jgi:uncharacterized protein
VNRRSALLLFAAAVLVPAGCKSGGQTSERASPARAPAPTVVVQAGGRPVAFRVEVARTPEEQERGLMYRSQLDTDAGMLFVFGAPSIQRFWMKNTLIPLDMLFIAADGRVADIHERAVPLSEATIYSKVPVRAVLELNGGTVSRLGIHLGDVVHFPIFGN